MIADLETPVGASVQTRLAYGYALAGELDDFDRAYATGLDLIANRDPADWAHLLPTDVPAPPDELPPDTSTPSVASTSSSPIPG